MATIILKGTQKEIECTVVQAESINKLKEQRADPKTMLNISGVSVELGDIRYAMTDRAFDKDLIAEEKQSENDEHYNRVVKEYNSFIEKRCYLSVEEKSKDVKLFETLYFGVKNKKLTEEQKECVSKMQREYFEKNPRHPYAKVNYFKLLKDLPVAKDDWNDMPYHVGSFSLRLIRNVLEEAFKTAHNLKLITN